MVNLDQPHSDSIDSIELQLSNLKYELELRQIRRFKLRKFEKHLKVIDRYQDTQQTNTHTDGVRVTLSKPAVCVYTHTQSVFTFLMCTYAVCLQCAFTLRRVLCVSSISLSSSCCSSSCSSSLTADLRD